MDWILIIVLGIAVFAVIAWRRFSGVELTYRSAMLQAGRRKADESERSLEDPGRGVVRITEDGFSLTRPDGALVDVKWDEVTEITAYKADIFAYDLICLVFSRSDRDGPVEVDEEMYGYKKFQCALKAQYGPGLLDDWWTTVAFPAFVPNETVIWPPQESAQPPAENA